MPTPRRLTVGKSRLFRPVALCWLAVVFTVGCGTPPASLVFAEGTPPDLQELGLQVWEEFIAVFPNQAGCIGEVTMEGDWTLEGSRAYYLPDDARVVLEIPATAPHLRHSMIHELAHHIEHVCADHIQLRGAFLEAQDLPPDTPWFDGPSWEETPSEQYAEAVVRLLLSRPVMHYRLSVTAEAVEAVRKWGGGP